MSERPKEHRKDSAQSRRAAALRDNLKRRKAQARGRQEGRAQGREPVGERVGEPAGSPGGPHDSAGIGAEK